jgi:hypothetical protein
VQGGGLRWHWVRQKDVPEAYVRRILFTSAVDAARGRKISSRPLQEEQLPGEPDPAIEGVTGRAALLNCVRALPGGQRADRGAGCRVIEGQGDHRRNAVRQEPRDRRHERASVAGVLTCYLACST